MDQPKPNETQSSFSSWKIIKRLLSILLVVFIAVFAFKVYECFFAGDDIKLMRGRFLNSNLAAIPSYCRKYDKVAHNAYDPEQFKELDKKIVEYQGPWKDKKIGFFPLQLNGQFEHLPRKNLFYFSHDFDFNFKNFLQFKRDLLSPVCHISLNDKAKDRIKNGDKEYEKEQLTNYAAYNDVDKAGPENPEFATKLYGSFNDVVQKHGMVDFFKTSLALLQSVDRKEFYELDKSSGKFFEAMKDFLLVLYPNKEYLFDLKQADKFHTKDADVAVHMIIKQLGMGRPTPPCSFVFSRLLYGIHYLTLDTMVKGKDGKILKSKSRIDHVFASLIHHFQFAYPESELPGFFTRIFKPKMEPVSDEDKAAYEDTYKLLIEQFKLRVNSIN